MRFLFTFLILILTSCANDISVSDAREVRVIVDSYIQPDPVESLDILIALDTSGSMSDNYDDVSNGMSLLRSDISNITLDYRFGFITMDPTNNGFGGPLDSSATSIDILMAPHLLPQTGLEEGFAATYSFLNSEESTDFRRDDADFLLFLISDEDEQSSITASLFKEWLSGEMSSVTHDVVCISTLDKDDPSSSWGESIGWKYIDLANLYSKGAVDIDSDDWSLWLSESSYLTRVVDIVALSEPDPIIDSIIVYVDGGLTNEWTYSSVDNSVKLSFLPDYGSLVEVGYNIYI